MPRPPDDVAIQATEGLSVQAYRLCSPWNDQRLAVIVAWPPADRGIGAPIAGSAVGSIGTVKRAARISVGTANPAEPLPAASFRAANPLTRTMPAHRDSCRRFPAVNADISRTRDMAGRLQANDGCSHCDRQNELMHLAGPEIPYLTVVKRVGRFSQYIAATGLKGRAENVLNAGSGKPRNVAREK